MTVGIAALALEGKAIVLMADKLITEKGDLKIERDQTKGAFLPNGWMALYAGGTTFAELVLSHVPAVFEKAVEKQYTLMLASEVMDLFHKGYLDVWEFLVEQEILRQRLLTADQYRAGISDQTTREMVEAEKRTMEEEYAPEFLLCGFDNDGNGNIIYIGLRDLENSGAVGAIGSGGPTALARLIWQQTNQNDELARVVYEVYTAKAHAEKHAYVGPGFDAFVMFGNGYPNIRRSSEPTKGLLIDLFKYHDQTPFRLARRPGERSEPKHPADDWEKTFIEEILPLPDHLVAIRKRILRQV